MVLALLVAGLVMLAINRTVVAPLREAVGHCQRIAGGDLTGTICRGSRNEIGQLFSALSDMQSRLRGIVTTLHASSDSVATGATHIAEGSQDLASRTEEQATALQQTASLVEETSTAAANLKDEAQRLSEVVGTFKFEAAQASRTPAAPFAPAAAAAAPVTNRPSLQAPASGSRAPAQRQAQAEPEWEEF